MAGKALILVAVVLFAATAAHAQAEEEEEEEFAAELAAWAKGTACTPAQRAAQLTTCKAALTKLAVPFDGATVLCPTNWAFVDFAEELGFKGKDPVAAVLAGVPAAALKTLLSHHVVPKSVLATAAFKAGRRTLTSAAGAPISVLKRANGGLEVVPNGIDVDDDGDTSTEPEDEEVDTETADLTFEGAFKAGGKYIIHAVDDVMVPPALAAPLRAIRAKNMKAGRRMLSAYTCH
ncbi:MAG: hypothetical protein J3K34DRAFT_496873 [Monoraphidium minutum]|nr:MAG: hypothetical protein J3K34DRAFT_496873 [Monoraphidium minutum]